MEEAYSLQTRPVRLVKVRDKLAYLPKTMVLMDAQSCVSCVSDEMYMTNLGR